MVIVFDENMFVFCFIPVNIVKLHYYFEMQKWVCMNL